MLKLLGHLFLKLIGGSRNERLVRARLRRVREEINPLEDEIQRLSDEELLVRSDELRQRRGGGEPRDAILPEAFALVREAARRSRSHRHFDVQLVAGMILDEGTIAEEATGEGKTIACYPAIYMAWLDGMHSHVVTTNDYLVQRDAEFAEPIFALLGVTVGYITSEMNSKQRQPMYARDVTYGTNSEFGFDYLRDNMKLSTAEQVQGPLDYAIIDEVDNILIDEARTPLIISGPAHGGTGKYSKADSVAREVINKNRPWDQANKAVESLRQKVTTLEGELDRAKGDEDRRKEIRKELDEARENLAQAEATLRQKDQLYEVELDKKSVNLTHEGVGVAQEIAGVGSFYVGANMEWPHLMNQALRAHLVYERDKDYIVRDGKVVIVDEFTGRLMEGREWSDGLHQAVEAKERVTVKKENQTLATITLQNFFKMYKKLAGMTGTALTEANEFSKIYKLDVVAVRTHRPVNRVDHEDRIYADTEAKYDAIVEEVKHYSRDLGRPVLVGTTSIEKSEALSNMLQKRYGIDHQVLNGRPENAARENEIVVNAGLQRPLKQGSKQMVGTVTIATNMAGRGTDIKLGAGVVYDKCKVPDEQTLRDLGVEPDPLYPSGVNKCCIHCQQYDAATNCAHCFKPKLDQDFPERGRTRCREEVPCGMHMVGTERHEARRIDNQLRGRSGRQGDPGSSRFFLSLRDELITIFAGDWMLKVLGWLGLQGEASIEDRRISKGIERAQKKVEERNFEIRKNLLEYDEVMDYQRKEFYSRRQTVLEGRNLEGLVMDMVVDVIDEAAASYLDGQYVKRCIAEWGRQTVRSSIQPGSIRGDTMDEIEDIQRQLREAAKDEANNEVAITLGEYMDDAIPPEEWDLRGLSSWAMSRFGVQLSQNQLRKMDPPEVEEHLTEAAAEKIEKVDLSGVAAFLTDGYAVEALAEWARQKFAMEQITADDLSETPDEAAEKLIEIVQAGYHHREIEYPVEHAMDMTVAQAGTENVYAMETLVGWANRKYQAGLALEDVLNAKPKDIYERLLGEARKWDDDDAIRRYIRSRLGDSPDIEPAIELAKNRFDTELTEEDFQNAEPMDVLVRVGRSYLRREMTELERFVLLQILDSSWKDHLLSMDHLRDSIGLRGYAEQDPRVAYKREGSEYFRAMLAGVRDKVTDMIFKVRLTGESEMASVYEVSNTVHEQLQGYDHLAQDMADQQQAAEPQPVKQIVRDVPKVGRNDPCPCGSGKKYKKCCGRDG